MIEKYDVTIDTDGDGSSLSGTVTILGHEHKLEMTGGGRDLFIEIDGEPAPEEMCEGLGEWLDPFDAVQPILNEIAEPYEIENWSGRIVDGKVVRLIVQDGRELRVVCGALVDETILPKVLLAIEAGMESDEIRQTWGDELADWFAAQAARKAE